MEPLAAQSGFCGLVPPDFAASGSIRATTLNNRAGRVLQPIHANLWDFFLTQRRNGASLRETSSPV